MYIRRRSSCVVNTSFFHKEAKVKSSYILLQVTDRLNVFRASFWPAMKYLSVYDCRQVSNAADQTKKASSIGCYIDAPVAEHEFRVYSGPTDYNYFCSQPANAGVHTVGPSGGRFDGRSGVVSVGVSSVVGFARTQLQTVPPTVRPADVL